MTGHQDETKNARPPRHAVASILLIGILLGGGMGIIAGFMMANPDVSRRFGLPISFPTTAGGPVKEFTLTVQEAKLPLGGTTWTAWTYNGTVPGPTLKVKVGETYRVRLINKLNLTHSFHSHHSPYPFTSDGSQANVIAGIGSKAMVTPGQEYTYEFHATRPGIFYYHCHSADKFPITTHIRNGLYGAIIADEPEKPPAREVTVFFSEVDLPGRGRFYVLNGKSVPGGEHGLEQIYREKGFQGVAEQLNRTVLAYKAKVGETVRFHIFNLGDEIHSFHIHGHPHLSEAYFPGRSWPADLVQLVPGAAETLLITAQSEGVWLFHCHVVFHADAGMIGVFIVER